MHRGCKLILLLLLSCCGVGHTFAEESEKPIPRADKVDATPAKEPEKVAALRQFLFEKCMENCNYKTVFVDYTSDFEEAKKSGVVDPSDELLKLLAKDGRDVRKGSEAYLFPSSHAITDKAGASNCAIINAIITKWVDDNTAEVSFGYYCHRLGGSSTKATAYFRDGGWTLRSPNGFTTIRKSQA